MALVIVFFEQQPDNRSEMHFFESDNDGLRFSSQNLHRRHLVRQITEDRWHRAADDLSTFCEHGSLDGDYCEPCNQEMEAARLWDELAARNLI